ncbi:MAG: DUF58 domain-containing protein [Ferruginibacter sp.]
MSFTKKYIGDLFVTQRFYVVMGSVVAAYFLSFFFPVLYPIVNVLFAVTCLLVLADYLFLFVFFKPPIGKRRVADRLSNGEENSIGLSVTNKMPFVINLQVIDEFPEQMQERAMRINKKLPANKTVEIKYSIVPLNRGAYQFGNIIVYLESLLGLLQKRETINAAETVRVYPSFINLGRYQLMAQTVTNEYGGKRMRKIGQSMEFEQIKDYVGGDDIRTINWKATARKGTLMVNNYTDEKSQQVYCIIDKGRLMKMPFYGLSLLDYAINATLAVTNICLQKQDKIGLLSFSNKMGNVVAADRKPIQRENIMQVLYKENTAFLESDYEMLYMQVRNKIKQRSLLILFTNFESLNGLNRQVNYLRSIAKHHLLLVVFFENTELTKLSGAQANTVEDIYVKTIADKLAFEKRLVVKELLKYGILSILSSPQNLTVNTINKYLELKSKQVL